MKIEKRIEKLIDKINNPKKFNQKKLKKLLEKQDRKLRGEIEEIILELLDEI